MLRRASVGDLDAIMVIETSEFGTDAWPIPTMAAELMSEHSYYLVAVPNGAPDAVVAYAGLRAPAGVEQADIQTIAVAPDSRRSGLGRALMLQLMTEARQRGAREIFLEVRADNPGAKSLYEQLGFAEIGVRANYYQPDGVDAIIMRAPLSEAETTWATQ